MFGLTRQDKNYIMAHLLAFILGYSGMMAQIHHNFPNVWFDWNALTQGLLTAGVANLSIGISGDKKG